MKEVTLEQGPFTVKWRGTPGERDMIDADVYRDGKLVLQWQYGRVVGSSIMGNAYFWMNQVCLQAHDAKPIEETATSTGVTP